MSAKPKLNGPFIGDRVRSFDFDCHDLEGERACYMEGQITGVDQFEGCWRYKIEVRRSIFRGQEMSDFPSVIFPPINGTPTWTGRVTGGVEVI